MRKAKRTFKVWVWPEALAQDLRNGGTAAVHPRRDGFKRRIKATLTLSPPKKKRSKR